MGGRRTLTRSAPTSPLLALVLVAAAVWHVFAVLSPGWVGASRPHAGRDFASYFYAVRAAQAGQDPYDRRVLSGLARADGSRGAVHPFFYPPPFIAFTSWIGSTDLQSAFRIWFWLDELAALLAALALWRWWRALDPVVPGAVAVLFALTTALPNNHIMGQANLPVLALVLGGLYAERSGRDLLGGALVGVACMAKMSPALFVAWWLLRGSYRPVAAACGTAIALTLLSLPWVGAAHQLGFYTSVLPQFASGDYNGLGVPIQLFGNHSIPNVLDRTFPSPTAALSGGARAASSAIALAGLAGLGWAFRRRTDDPWSVAGQISAISVWMLLLPVYTYEHHLVWALPAAVCAVAAAAAGRLSTPLALICGAAVALLAFDLQELKALSEWLDGGQLGMLVQELKFLALLALLGATTWIGARAR